MALDILERITPGGRAGRSFGEGLQTGLQQLLDTQIRRGLEEMQARKQSALLREKEAGQQRLMQSRTAQQEQERAAMEQSFMQNQIPQDLAQLLSRSHPSLQKEILSRYGQMQQQAQLSPEAVQNMSPQQLNQIMLQNQTRSPLEMLENQTQQQAMEHIYFPEPQAPQIPKQTEPSLKNIFAQEKPLSPYEKKKLALTEAKMEQDVERDWQKMIEPHRNKLYEEGQLAQNNLQAIDEMEELDESGGLSSPNRLAILQFLGITPDKVPYAFTPEDQAFRKLEQVFLPGIRMIFGNKITAEAIKQYMAGIPKLLNTSEGRKKLYKYLRMSNMALYSRSKNMDDMLQERSKGKLKLTPDTWRAELNKRTDKDMQKYRKKMVDLEKELMSMEPQEQEADWRKSW